MVILTGVMNIAITLIILLVGTCAFCFLILYVSTVFMLLLKQGNTWHDSIRLTDTVGMKRDEEIRLDGERKWKQLLATFLWNAGLGDMNVCAKKTEELWEWWKAEESNESLKS